MDTENNERYCHDCGGGNLAHKENYACGEHYICRECGKENCFTPQEDETGIYTVGLYNVNGSATFTRKPSKELLDAVNRMAEIAYNKPNK